ADQVHRLDQLVAGGALVATEAVRVGALLHFLLAYGQGLDAAAGLDEVLLDVGALAAGKRFLHALALQGGFRHADALHGTHRRLRAEQDTPLVLQGHAERVAHDRRRVGAHRAHGGPELAWRAPRQPAGAGDVYRQPRDALELGRVEPSAAGEAPGAVE